MENETSSTAVSAPKRFVTWSNTRNSPANSILPRQDRSGGHPDLRLLLFVVAGLPGAHDRSLRRGLVDVASLHPHVLHARLVVADGLLLDDDRSRLIALTAQH